MSSSLKPKPGWTVIHSPKRLPVDHYIEPQLFAQIPLFQEAARHLLVFVTIPRATDIEFLEALSLARPSIAFDVRKFPRFDVGRLDRERVFTVFEEYNVRYIDFLHEPHVNQTSLAFDLVWKYLHRYVSPVSATVMVLLDQELEQAGVAFSIEDEFRKQSKWEWSTYCVPTFERKAAGSTSDLL